MNTKISNLNIVLLLVLMLFCLCFFTLLANAKESVDESTSQIKETIVEDGYEFDGNYYELTEDEDVNESALDLSNSYFSAEKDITLTGLAMRVSLIIILLTLVLLSLKFFFKGNDSSYSGFLFSFIKGFGSRFKDLNLKQTLTLAKGQIIYLVEVERKKLLLCSTNHGGVQFLADLSNEGQGELNFKQIELIQQESKKEPAFHPEMDEDTLLKFKKMDEETKDLKDIFKKQEVDNGSRQVQKVNPKPFKHRLKYSQMLLSNKST